MEGVGVHRSSGVRNLGVMLDRKLSLENHHKKVIRVNFFNLRNKIHHLLSQPLACSAPPTPCSSSAAKEKTL
jgi:hypothetical protein